MKTISRIFALLILAVIIVFGVYAGRYMLRISLTPEEDTVSTFRIASLNARGFTGMTSPEACAGFIRYNMEMSGVDILCLQETDRYKEFSNKELKGIFATLYPYSAIQQDQAIFSKFPIVDRAQTSIEGSDNSWSWNDIKTPEGIVRVFSLHLQSTGISMISDRSSLNGILAAKALISSSDKAHMTTAALIREEMEKSPYPVIVLGDFNTMPGTKAYKILCEGMKDSFLESGSGWGTTFKDAGMGMLRIDYILHDSRMECTRFSNVDEGMSDHKAVVAAISINKNV